MPTMPSTSSTPDPAPLTLQSLAALLRRYRLTFVREKATHKDIAAVLTRANIAFSYEHRLSDADIPDFLLPDSGIAIEAKVRRADQRTAIYRQLERYAEHDAVKAILLATNHPMTLPSAINGKPALSLHLGAAWL